MDVEDPIPPQVTAVNGLPAHEGTTDQVINSFSVIFSEDMDAGTINPTNPLVPHFAGHYYVRTPTTMNWPDAEAYAQSIGGHLAAINDAAEQAFLEDWFSHYSPWIGINDMDFDNIWRWSNGQMVSYTNWAAGQPDNRWSRDAAYMDGLGRWNSCDENENRWGLVELAGAAAADGDSDGVPDVLDVYPNDPLDAWDLREAGPDHTFGTADDVIYDVQVVQQYSTGLTVQLRIMDGPLGNGQYRFSVNASIRDRADNQLDGDGDGTGGDPYVHEFTVALPPEYAFEGRSNNTYAQATALALTEDPPGSGYFISQRGLGRIDPVSGGGPWSDPDVWCFQALAGDIVSVAADRMPGSGADTRLYLYDADGATLASDNDGGGQGGDAFISHYQIPADGTYYVAVGHHWGSTGNYQLRVDLARGVQLESDANYSNDSVAGADVLSLQALGSHRAGTIAGTIMYGESGNTDEDYFSLGTVSAGESIFLVLRLPDSSWLAPVLEVRDANNLVVAVEPDPEVAHLRVDITTTGTYYAVVVAVDGQGNTRHQYLLDAAIWPSSVAGFADLVPADVAGPVSASSGETVQITWQVDNQGNAGTDSSEWYDRVVLSPDEVYGNGNDVYLDSVLHSGVLQPADPPYAGVLNVQLPLGISGDYWIFVETDEDNDVFEYLFEGNNVVRSGLQMSIALTPYGDLEATDMQPDGPIGVAGEPFGASWTVTNRGNGTTGDGTPGGDVSDWTDRLVLSRNTVFGDGDDVFVADVPHSGALAAAQGYAGSWSGNLPAGLSGHYYMLVHTDHDDDVYEYSDTYSNVAVTGATVHIAPQVFADLEPVVTAPSAAPAGQPTTVEWTVTNTTDAWGPTPVDYWHDRIYYSPDDTYDGGDVYLGELRHDGALAVGESYNASKQVTIPAGASGTYYLFVVTDFHDRVYEFNYEGNNVAGRAVVADVTPPTVVSTVPSGVHEGGRIIPLTTQIEVTFSEPLDPADANNAANYELRDDGSNGVLGDGDDTIYSLTPAYTSGQTVVILTINAAPVAAGDYQLTIFGDASIRDVAGNRLDGDEDDVPGGNYVRAYEVVQYGDANMDGRVGIADLGALADNYGNTDAEWADGDFNGDRRVGIADLGALADNYGYGTGGEAQGAAVAGAPDASGSEAGAAQLADGLWGAPVDAAAGPQPAMAADASLPEVQYVLPLEASAGVTVAGAGEVVPASSTVTQSSAGGVEGPVGLDEVVHLLAAPELSALPAPRI